MRAWKCLRTRVSPAGTLIANDSPVCHPRGGGTAILAEQVPPPCSYSGHWLDIRRRAILRLAFGISIAGPCRWPEWTHQLPRPVGGASTRSLRCVALFLAQPSATAFPPADGQGGRRFAPVDASRPLASLEIVEWANPITPANISHNLARKYFWTCSRNYTVNDERLEYL
jgi:hypothetical protein